MNNPELNFVLSEAADICILCIMRYKRAKCISTLTKIDSASILWKKRKSTPFFTNRGQLLACSITQLLDLKRSLFIFFSHIYIGSVPI